MVSELSPAGAKKLLQEFQELFADYSSSILENGSREDRADLRLRLQQKEPVVSKLVLDIRGDSIHTFGGGYVPRFNVAARDVIRSALLGGNNAMPHNFVDSKAVVEALLNEAIGTVDAGLWPQKKPSPILVINDVQLKERCLDLLNAPNHYDRVVREATTILEDRIRAKVGHERLAQLIPNSGDQAGENLVNRVFSPDKPVLEYSSEKLRRIQFHRMLLGVVSFVRNQIHHSIDDSVEWSWAWSVVGLVDRLLTDVEACSLK